MKKKRRKIKIFLMNFHYILCNFFFFFQLLNEFSAPFGFNSQVKLVKKKKNWNGMEWNRRETND